MTRFAVFALVAFLAVGVQPVMGQENVDAPISASGKISVSHLEAARDILKITNSQANMSSMIDVVVPSILNIVQKSDSKISNDALEKFKVEFREEMQNRLPDLVAMEAEVYARHFTEAELRELIEFYQTPLGKKLLKEQPSIMQDNVTVGRMWGSQAGEAAMEKVLARMHKDGAKP